MKINFSLEEIAVRGITFDFECDDKELEILERDGNIPTKESFENELKGALKRRVDTIFMASHRDADKKAYYEIDKSLPRVYEDDPRKKEK